MSRDWDRGSRSVSGVILPEAGELDDEEFNLPPVETPPTLESILSEDIESENEVDPFLSEEAFIGLPVDNTTTDTAVVSVDLIKPTNWCKNPPLLPVAQGSVLHHIILKGLSAQIASAADRVDAGTPTAMAVSDLIAIGTLHGLILIFDPKQTLKLCLGSTALGAQYGAISALTFNNDSTHLLCGFARGQIIVWDSGTGKLLRTIIDAHPPGSAVLNIKFTVDPTLAVCNDSSSNVFELHFKRAIGTKTYESRCLFSGTKSEVCCIEPLQICEEFMAHPVAQYCLLAMVSLTKLLVVALKPSLKILYRSPCGKGQSNSVPLLAWQFVWTRERLDPVLAFCRGSKIIFFHVNCAGDQIEFASLMEIDLQYEIINLKWVNSRTILLQDGLDKLHVIDRESCEELESHSLADVHLIRSCSYFDSLESKQTMSLTMCTIQEKACYQSIWTYGGQTVFLGAKSVHVISLKAWHERIDFLTKQEQFSEALALGWAFHEGTAKATVGLPGENQKKKALVKDKMVDVILQYIQATLKSCPQHGKIQVMEEHYQKAIPVCVVACILIDKIDLLCGCIYEKLSPNAVALGVLLECLEPHILSNRLTGITPQAVKDLVVHFEDKGMLDSIEALIVHLDVTTLDIHQIVSLSRAHGLYDILVHVFNKGMNDYVTPLEEMIQAIDSILKTGKLHSKELVTIGNKVLVYLSCCLSGRAYPLGDIPEDLVLGVKKEVFHSLTRAHSNNAEPGKEPHHNIRTLLKCNTREFLNVLALSFEDLQKDKLAVEFQQRITDILLKVMVEGTEFTPSQIGCLFTFLARQLARAESSLFVNKQLFDRVHVLDFLCDPEDSSQHEEIQQALLELLQAGGIVYFDEEKLISLADKVQFYRVCEFVYERKRLHSKILMCYVHDEARKIQVHDYIYHVLNNVEMTKDERVSFKEEIFNHIHELLDINPRQTAVLILREFSSCIATNPEILKDPQLLFQFLNGLLDPSILPWPFQEASLLNPEYHETYIDLLCQKKPDLVTTFLTMSENYRLEEAIETVKKHQVDDALAYLLEKQGNVQGAVSVLLENLKNKLNSLAESFHSKKSNAGLQEFNIEIPGLYNVQTSLEEMIKLCQRSSRNLNFEQKEELWFPLLELIMAPSHHLKIKISSPFADGIKELIKMVLNSMTAHIPPTAILQKVIQDPGYSMGKFGDVRDLILGMLDTFDYEQTLMETTKNILNHDLHWSLSNLRAMMNRGLKPHHKICGICTKHYSERLGLEEEVILFSCGHVYHSYCLQTKHCFGEFGADQHWLCFRCTSSKRTGKTADSVKPASQHMSLPTKIAIKATQQPLDKEKIVDTEDYVLDPRQFAAFDHTRTVFQNPSRLALLLNAARQNTAVTDNTNIVPKDLHYLNQSSIIQSKTFKLQLVPPPLVD